MRFVDGYGRGWFLPPEELYAENKRFYNSESNVSVEGMRVEIKNLLNVYGHGDPNPDEIEIIVRYCLAFAEKEYDDFKEFLNNA